MPDLYCTPKDVYDLGARRGSFPNPARLVSDVSLGDGSIGLGEHGLSLDDVCSFRTDGGGGVLASPLQTGVTYYAIPTSAERFRVAAYAGGPAIALATAGARMMVVTPLPLLAKIEEASRLIDDMVPGMAVPLVAPYPPIVVITTAELTAGLLGVFARPEAQSFSALVDFTQKRMAAWAKGRNPRSADGQTPTQLTVSAAASSTSYASVWRRFGGLGGI